MLLRMLWLSLDPYMRDRMSDAPSYAKPVGIGDAMEGDGCEPALAVCPAPPRNRAPEASNIPEALAGRFICKASLSDREQQLALNQMVAATLFDRCLLFV
jgi:hypothetical protein